MMKLHFKVKGLTIPILVLFSVFALQAQEEDPVGPVKYLKYFDLGAGYSTQSYTVINAGLSADMTNEFAFFFEYDLTLKKLEILAHQVSMKIGPFYKFNDNSYFAFSSGLSFLFANEGISQREPAYPSRFMLALPIQLKATVGITRTLGIGLKGTYYMALSDGEKNLGTAVVYISCKLKD